MSLGSTLMATLGLNISRFRAGLNDAVKSAGDARRKMAKDLGGLGGGGLLRLVGIGALVSGFMSATREAQRLRDAADETGEPISASARAAAELADNLEWSKSKMTELANLAAGSLQRGIENVAIALTAAFSEATMEGIRAQREAEREADRIAAANARREREAARERDNAAKEAERLAERLAKLKADAMKERERGAQIGETSIERTARITREYVAAINDANNTELTALQRAEAKVLAQQKANELLQIEHDIAQAIVDAENEINDSNAAYVRSLREQLAILKDQTKEAQSQLGAMEQMRTLPSLQEVASGERNIGPAARRQARELERQREREQRARDREQRAMEREDRERSTGGKEAARRERDKAAEDAASARQRQREIETALEGRVRDIGNETAKAQLDRLTEILKASEETAMNLRNVGVNEP